MGVKADEWRLLSALSDERRFAVAEADAKGLKVYDVRACAMELSDWKFQLDK